MGQPMIGNWDPVGRRGLRGDRRRRDRARRVGDDAPGRRPLTGDRPLRAGASRAAPRPIDSARGSARPRVRARLGGHARHLEHPAQDRGRPAAHGDGRHDRGVRGAPAPPRPSAGWSLGQPAVPAQARGSSGSCRASWRSPTSSSSRPRTGAATCRSCRRLRAARAPLLIVVVGVVVLGERLRTGGRARRRAAAGRVCSRSSGRGGSCGGATPGTGAPPAFALLTGVMIATYTSLDRVGVAAGAAVAVRGDPVARGRRWGCWSCGLARPRVAGGAFAPARARWTCRTAPCRPGC